MDNINIPGLDIQGGSVGVFSFLSGVGLNSFAWSDTAFGEPGAKNNMNKRKRRKKTMLKYICPYYFTLLLRFVALAL